MQKNVNKSAIKKSIKYYSILNPYKFKERALPKLKLFG